ncbi:MAG TPA: hypothetical protein VMR98_02335, partial [Candidatus Polarisedimenticolaceae bacterium]|nr:hypothetical protein [Candidatus Polarisedimenticolaceae bacterium]
MYHDLPGGTMRNIPRLLQAAVAMVALTFTLAVGAQAAQASYVLDSGGSSVPACGQAGCPFG